MFLNILCFFKYFFLFNFSCFLVSTQLKPEYHDIHLEWNSIDINCVPWIFQNPAPEPMAYEDDFDAPEEPRSIADCFAFYFYDAENQRISDADCEKMVKAEMFPQRTIAEVPQNAQIVSLDIKDINNIEIVEKVVEKKTTTTTLKPRKSATTSEAPTTKKTTTSTKSTTTKKPTTTNKLTTTEKSTTTTKLTTTSKPTTTKKSTTTKKLTTTPKSTTTKKSTILTTERTTRLKTPKITQKPITIKSNANLVERAISPIEKNLIQAFNADFDFENPIIYSPGIVPPDSSEVNERPVCEKECGRGGKCISKNKQEMCSCSGGKIFFTNTEQCSLSYGRQCVHGTLKYNEFEATCLCPRHLGYSLG